MEKFSYLIVVLACILILFVGINLEQKNIGGQASYTIPDSNTLSAYETKQIIKTLDDNGYDLMDFVIREDKDFAWLDCSKLNSALGNTDQLPYTIGRCADDETGANTSNCPWISCEMTGDCNVGCLCMVKISPRHEPSAQH